MVEKVIYLKTRNDILRGNINNNTITNENKMKLLGIILGSKLLFEDHNNSL